MFKTSLHSRQSNSERQLVRSPEQDTKPACDTGPNSHQNKINHRHTTPTEDSGKRSVVNLSATREEKKSSSAGAPVLGIIIQRHVATAESTDGQLFWDPPAKPIRRCGTYKQNICSNYYSHTGQGNVLLKTYKVVGIIASSIITRVWHTKILAPTSGQENSCYF